MKDTIAAIISEYRLDKINYGLIVFGDAATVQIQFGDYSNVNNLLRDLGFIPKKRSGASLVDALREADSLFSSSDVFHSSLICTYVCCFLQVWTKVAFQCRTCAMICHKKCIQTCMSYTHCVQ